MEHNVRGGLTDAGVARDDHPGDGHDANLRALDHPVVHELVLAAHEQLPGGVREGHKSPPHRLVLDGEHERRVGRVERAGVAPPLLEKVCPYRLGTSRPLRLDERRDGGSDVEERLCKERGLTEGASRALLAGLLSGEVSGEAGRRDMGDGPEEMSA